MITSVEVKNYKSITDLVLPLGQINVLIGANGSGKSNILEAIALGSAAANDTLDNEFLASRGVRVSDDARFMRSAFDKKMAASEVRLTFGDSLNETYSFELQKDNDKPYSSWRRNRIASINFKPFLNTADENRMPTDIEERLRQSFKAVIHDELKENPLFIEGKRFDVGKHEESLVRVIDDFVLRQFRGPVELRHFLVYSPEYSALRTFAEEGQIQPLGIRGEGLFRCLRIMSVQDRAGFDEIKARLRCIDWYDDFDIDHDLAPGERRLQIHDRFLDPELTSFDQKSANEGFLFLLFYLCLFISKDTPQFFAIDNVDASLHPKLCAQLMMELCEIAQANQKQVIFTTHNPAVLDGLNLTDDEQRLFVVSRNRQGHTRVKRIPAPQPTPGTTPVRLSEAFLRGYLGGLPDNF